MGFLGPDIAASETLDLIIPERVFFVVVVALAALAGLAAHFHFLSFLSHGVVTANLVVFLHILGAYAFVYIFIAAGHQLEDEAIDSSVVMMIRWSYFLGAALLAMASFSILLPNAVSNGHQHSSWLTRHSSWFGVAVLVLAVIVEAHVVYNTSLGFHEVFGLDDIDTLGLAGCHGLVVAFFGAFAAWHVTQDTLVVLNSPLDKFFIRLRSALPYVGSGWYRKLYAWVCLFKVLGAAAMIVTFFVIDVQNHNDADDSSATALTVAAIYFAAAALSIVITAVHLLRNTHRAGSALLAAKANKEADEREGEAARGAAGYEMEELAWDGAAANTPASRPRSVSQIQENQHQQQPPPQQQQQRGGFVIPVPPPPPDQQPAHQPAQQLPPPHAAVLMTRDPGSASDSVHSQPSYADKQPPPLRTPPRDPRLSQPQPAIVAAATTGAAATAAQPRRSAILPPTRVQQQQQPQRQSAPGALSGASAAAAAAAAAQRQAHDSDEDDHESDTGSVVEHAQDETVVGSDKPPATSTPVSAASAAAAAAAAPAATAATTGTAPAGSNAVARSRWMSMARQSSAIPEENGAEPSTTAGALARNKPSQRRHKRTGSSGSMALALATALSRQGTAAGGAGGSQQSVRRKGRQLNALSLALRGFLSAGKDAAEGWDSDEEFADDNDWDYFEDDEETSDLVELARQLTQTAQRGGSGGSGTVPESRPNSKVVVAAMVYGADAVPSSEAQKAIDSLPGNWTDTFSAEFAARFSFDPASVRTVLKPGEDGGFLITICYQRPNSMPDVPQERFEELLAESDLGHLATADDEPLTITGFTLY